jgi:SagB-type dehydrogenase family enzyme
MKPSLVLAALAAILAAGVPAGAQTIALPAADRTGETSLESAIYGRSSRRAFAEAPLSLEEAGQLLWAAVGRTVDGVSGPTRASASAGGLYPVEAYLVAGNVDGLEPGVYHYRWRSHELELTAGGDRLGRLRRAALFQAAVSRAPAAVVLAGDYAVTARRYGERGTERYVHMDAGHAAQNVLLQAEALDLAAVPIGAFSDAAVRRTLDLELAPLYIIPVGPGP